MKKLIIWLFYIFFVVVLTLAGTEFILRTVNPLGTDYLFEAPKYFKIMKSDPIYAYIHRAGTNDNFQGVDVRINSEGFRGQDFAIQKDKDTYRILLLGDSVVFGWGVKEEDSLASQLKPILKEKGFKEATSKKVEILPIGVGSWNTRTQYEFMKERGIDYQADLVIWLIVANDLEPKSRGRTHIPLEKLREPPKGLIPDVLDSYYPETRRWLASKSHLWALVERFKRVGYMQKLSALYLEPESLQAIDAKDAVFNLASLLKTKQVPLIAAIYGEMVTANGKAYHQLYSDFFKEAEIPYFTFSDQIYDPSMVNSYIDPHQNRDGLKIMAEDIAEYLNE